ncbi:MAG: TraB/GumN family protein [Planctomycetota bacterium]|nr:MAG: TraB/GumN family protein [Planctomycetota bacterium]
MRLLHLGLIALLCLLGTLTLATEEINPPDHPFLWRISGIDGGPDSFAFGTIHLSDPQVTTFHPQVLAALEAADVTYTEIPMGPADMAEMMMAAYLPAGQRLSTLLPAELQQQLDRELRLINRHLSLVQFDRIKVWAIAASIWVLENEMKHAGKPSVDLIVWREGQQEGKESRALETIADQLAIFDNMPMNEQLDMLRETLELRAQLREEGRDALQELIAFYRAGRTDNFDEYLELFGFNSEDEQSLKFMDKLLGQRNVQMVEKMVKHMRAEPDRVHFFAAGAAHFIDADDGIPALLRQAGVEIERLLPPPVLEAATP